MNFQTEQKVQTCPLEELSVYLDGELSAPEELILEKHLSICTICTAQLNQHKKMLSAMNFVFEAKDGIELPKNFAKVVVIQAESTVSGLRSKKERFRALSLCAALFLLISIGLAAESDQVFYGVADFTGQVIAVMAIILHAITNFAIGLAIVLRCLSQKVILNTGFMFVVTACVFSIAAFSLSRVVLKFNRP